MRGANGGGIVFGNGASIGRRSLLIALVAFLLLAPSALGQIYQWEYVDPSDPSKGKKQGTMFTPDGATADPSELADIYGKNHTKAYLPGISIVGRKLQGTIFDDAYLAGADLRSLGTQGTWSGRYADFSGANFRGAHFGYSDLTGASFVGANLDTTFFEESTITDADFANAIIVNADLARATSRGLKAEQLYQTKSYKERQLGKINLGQNDLRGWDFSNQSMVDAVFNSALLEGTNFTDAVVGPADFVSSSLSAVQLYSTADYKSGVLDGIELGRSDLSGWNFANQSLVSSRLVEVTLSNASFEGANLTQATLGGIQNQFNEDVNFRGANMDRVRFDSGTKWRRADLTGAILTNTQLGGFAESTFDDAIITDSSIGFSESGFTTANFVSTASFQAGELTNIETRFADFSGLNLSGADISGARWIDLNANGADFSNVKAHNAALYGSMEQASFRNADLTNARLEWSGAPAIDFRGAVLTNTSFDRTFFSHVDITDAVVYGAGFTSNGNDIELQAAQLYSTASYKSRNLGPIRLQGDMRGWDFHNQDMTSALLRGQLQGANWNGTILDDAQIAAELPGTDFRATSLSKTYFVSFDASGSDFRGTNVSQARFSSGSLVGARFDGANLQNTGFSNTDIENVSFRDADMRGAGFNSIDSFAGVDFTGADIRGGGFSNLTSDGLTLNQIAQTKSYQDKDLSGVNFAHNEWPGSDWSEFSLVGANFNSAGLANANFSRANLTGANFWGADVTGANFTDAVIRQASFRSGTRYGFTRQMFESTASYKNRDLFGVNLDGVNLEFADLRGQDLRGADLRSTPMRGALLDHADLRSAFMPESFGPNTNPQPNDIPNADLSRTIRRNGRLDLLRVDPGEVLTIRNAVDMNGLPTPANIQLGVAVFNGGGTLRFLLSEDPWKSTLVVPSNRPEYLLSDTLELGFDRDTDPYALLDKPIQLILWPRSVRTGEFNVVSDPKYTWDLSALYTQGTVRLVGIVPEPATVATTLLLTAAAAGTVRRRRRQ